MLKVYIKRRNLKVRNFESERAARVRLAGYGTLYRMK